MKLSLKPHYLLTIPVLSIFIYSCNVKDKADATAFVNPPFETATDKPLETEVDASEGKTISLQNGTTIVIPANAFVDSNNNPITGKVNIKYKEFHDGADIILSGIPMTYDSAGIKNNFETAGMFELLGFQNGQPVFIGKDKSIDVRMGSYVGENNYNFYRLDTVAKNWVYKGIPTIQANESKKKKIESAIGAAVARPIEPKEFDPNKFVFDFKINTKNYPELTDFNNIIWQYDGKSDSLDPEKNKWIFSENWTNIQLEMIDPDNSTFWIKLSNKNKNFKSQVKPVFAGKKLEAAKKNYGKRLKEYETYVNNKRAAVERIKNECDFVRSLNVSQFGIYNHDRFYYMPNAVTFKADIQIDQEVDKRTKVFFITANNRTVIPYNTGPGNPFGYLPKAKSAIVAIVPGDKVAIFKDFESLGFTSENAPKEYTFKLKTIDKKINNSDDLRAILGI